MVPYRMKSVLKMKHFLALLLIAASADAYLDFYAAQLFDENDMNTIPDMVELVCYDGCLLYTTKTTEDVSLVIPDNDGVELKVLGTLDQIYQKKDGYLVGYPLAGTTRSYYLKKASARNITTPLKVYIVYNSAGVGYVTDFDSTDFDLSAAGKSKVTVLSNHNPGVTFTNFKGSKPPQVYAVGYDSAGPCNPLYKASSVDNAAKSSIGIISALITVDFVSADDSNQIHVSKYVSNINTATAGQNFVVMVSGVNGCKGNAGFPGYFGSLAPIEFKAGSESTKVDIKFGDMNITKGHVLTVKITGQDDLKVSGTGVQTYTYTSENLDVKFDWAAQDRPAVDYFYAQLDFSNGIARVFGIGSVTVVLFSLM